MRQRFRRRRLRFQRLERRRVLAGHPIITEFVASNASGLRDGFDQDSDWIEIRNDADVPVDLGGYHLTDSPNDLNQWEFPAATVLDPGEYLFVFASGRGIVDPSGFVHTNFQLDKDGEYLALTSPDQTVLSEYGSATDPYPPQITNLSYGVVGAQLVGPDSVAEYKIPTDDSLGLSWTTNSFDASANGFSLGRAAIGYENSPGSATSYASLFQTEIDSGTTNVFVRIPFEVEDAGTVADLALELNYDDGVVVYLNGTQVVGENVPNPLGFNTPASATHSDSLALAGSNYDLTANVNLLVDGQNTLAIHALNRPSSSDFLMVPKLRSGSIAGGVGYLVEPTPGSGNAQELVLGPFISDVESSLPVAQVGQPLAVTAKIEDFNTQLDPSTVRLHYRVMYGNEIELTMRDDGLGSDAIAGDRLFTAEIPSSAFQAGQMVRWRITAADTEGVVTQEPRFLDALDSAQYHGTIVADPSITTDVPVMHWFLENPSAASTNAGTRASLFVGGEFYDNIQVDNHGQSTRGSAFPKKSFDFDANSGNKFKIRPDVKRVSDFNLLTNYADQTKLRNSLMYDLFAQADYAHHFAFSMMVYRNGSFYGLYDVVEEGDTEYLDRLGHDTDNPLYKVNNRLDDPYNRIEKKSREYEDHSDFAEVVNAAQNLSGAAALQWDFDHLDIADMVNYLAIHNVAVSSDFGHKNMYWYRDTNGTGLWSVFPWDQDLSLGHQWDASISPPYFKDALVTDLNIYRGGNNIFGRLYSDPTFREMYTRRVRTLADQFYGPPGSPTGDSYLAENIVRLEALIADEAIEDMNFWGIQANFTHTPAEAAQQLLDEFIPLRRSYLDSHPDVPSSQVGTPTILFDPVDYDADPASGLQGEEYVRINNPGNVAVDISGWQIDGGIDHTFKGGTVIPASGSLYVVKDVAAFLARTTGPSGGSRLLIQGNYDGQLTFSGETLNLIASDGTVVDTLETPQGTPTINQQYLRVTEIHYHPLVGDTEFIEFTNISSGGVATTLDLTGVTITEGPSQPFVFPPGTTLDPGERLLVVQDLDEFIAKYPGVDPLSVAGTYLGKLSNSGERIKVVDSGGETLLDLDYKDSDPWPMSADGAGASLVLSDPIGTPINRLSKPYSYRGSTASDGSPGSSSLDTIGVVINELLTHTDIPQQDTIELFNTTDAPIDIGGWYLSDSKSIPLKYRIPSATVIPAGGYLTFDESQFNPTPLTPGPNDFALSGSQGDEVWMVIPDALETKVAQFVDQVTIGATLNGQTFGRLPDGSGRLSPLETSSLGARNESHQVSPVVISEVNYHPPQPSAEALAVDPTIESSDLEFVELHNASASAIDLTNWRLRGDADFNFIVGQSLAAGETIVLIPFDPESVANVDLLAAFRVQFGLDTSTRLLGPLSGSLGNSYGRVELEQPDAAPVDDPTVMPRVTVDEFLYDDLTPWPEQADGGGSSIHRISENAFANAAASWYGAEPSPGTTRYRPQVTQVSINGGSVQRSVVTSIEVSFDRPVNVTGESFELLRHEDQQLVTGIETDIDNEGDHTVVTLSFAAGPLVQARTSGNSLDDGNYRLIIHHDAVQAATGSASMKDDVLFGASETDAFFRQFGDSDGDRDVDGQDYGRFGLTFLKSLGTSGFDDSFDFDGDGDVDGQDYGNFGTRFLKTMPF